MNFRVRTFTCIPGTMPIDGDRHYVELNVSMSRAQMENAIVNMLGKLTHSEAAQLLRSEFPELFQPEIA